MTDNLAERIDLIGRNARAAAGALRERTSAERTAAISAIASGLRRAAPEILDANAADAAQSPSSDAARLDRMLLNPARLEAIAAGVDVIAELNDPTGVVIAEWTRPNGLLIQRVRVPIGVIGMIFEGRPNVAADASALALRSGNVIILRGGSESIRTITAISGVIRRALAEAKLPQDAVQIVPSTDRAAVGMMLAGMDGAIDVIIPRGGKSLVARVQEEARVPVLAHLEGICHTYVHADANAEKAIALVVNAKMRRVSVCGATETLLIDRAIASALLADVGEPAVIRAKTAP
jgi:glutamate-5-semialdehyde dehydrogenase